jgi:hypothetical protein
MKRLLVIAALALSIAPLAQADPPEVAYRTGGAEWAKTWKTFYDVVDHEPEISTPLTKAGPKMVPAIIEAIGHKDMKRRRYAISALGLLKDRRAIDPLTAIVKTRARRITSAGTPSRRSTRSIRISARSSPNSTRVRATTSR